MSERLENNNLPTQAQIAQAMNLYQDLLDHYNIDQRVQGAVWKNVLKDFKDNPGKIVGEIQGYWKTAFGVNGSGNNNNGHTKDLTHDDNILNHENEKSNAEIALNKWRRDWRDESFLKTREGGKTKAEKKIKPTKK